MVGMAYTHAYIYIYCIYSYTYIYSICDCGCTCMGDDGNHKTTGQAVAVRIQQLLFLFCCCCRCCCYCCCCRRYDRRYRHKWICFFRCPMQGFLFFVRFFDLRYSIFEIWYEFSFYSIHKGIKNIDIVMRLISFKSQLHFGLLHRHRVLKHRTYARRKEVSIFKTFR